MSTIYKSVLIMWFCCVFQITFGQQTPTFSEYNYNVFILNSAYAGFEKDTEVTLSSSGFFNELEGAPKSATFSFNSSLRDKNVGLGLGVIHDEIGVSKTITIFAAYSYKLFFDSVEDRPHWQHYYPTVLSFGITAGAQFYRDNLLDLGIVSDPNFQQNINATIPAVGVGIMYNYKNLFVGASAPNILGTKFATVDNLELSSPFYLYGGYRFFNNIFREIMFKPSFLLKKESGTALQTDINMAVNFKNNFEVGAGYRTNGSLNLLVGLYAVKNMRFVYNYNMASGNSPIPNTHGLTLNYRFGDGFSK